MTNRDKANRDRAAMPNTVQPSGDAGATRPGLSERDFAAALVSVGAVADRDMVCRVQRRVRERSMEAAEQRQRARHAVGLAILGFSLLLLVLTPVLWSGFHLASWNFQDFETQFVCMIGWLFPATLLGLFLAFLRMRVVRGSRRIDHRLDARLGSMVR